MAILCLADDIEGFEGDDSGRIIVAYNYDGEPVYAKDLHAVGSMAALLKDAIKPNIIQTVEHTPALVHGGPFANIAHGCNSVRATKTASENCRLSVLPRLVLALIWEQRNLWISSAGWQD